MIRRPVGPARHQEMARSIQSIIICTEILGGPERVGDVMQIIHRTAEPHVVAGPVLIQTSDAS